MTGNQFGILEMMEFPDYSFLLALFAVISVASGKTSSLDYGSTPEPANHTTDADNTTKSETSVDVHSSPSVLQTTSFSPVMSTLTTEQLMSESSNSVTRPATTTSGTTTFDYVQAFLRLRQNVTNDEDGRVLELKPTDTGNHTLWFIPILRGNCSEVQKHAAEFLQELSSSISSWLRQPPDSKFPQLILCAPNVQVNMTLTLPDDIPNDDVAASLTINNVYSRLAEMQKASEPLLYFRGDGYRIIDILTGNGFISNLSDNGFIPNSSIPVDDRHTNVDLVILIAVGSTCVFLGLLVLLLLTCRFCDRVCDSNNKAYQLTNPTAPNLNVTLEDYTLTRIPRPRLGYVDYCRGGIGLGNFRFGSKRYSPLDEKLITCGAVTPVTTVSDQSFVGSTFRPGSIAYTGMVQPFDTSVVPLEDIHTLDSGNAGGSQDGLIMRPSTLYQQSSDADVIGLRSSPFDAYHSSQDLHQHVLRGERIKGLDNPSFQ